MTLCVVEWLVHEGEEICVCAKLCACAGLKEVFTMRTPPMITADCEVLLMLLMKVFG